MSSGDWKDMVYAIRDGKIEIVKYHISNGVNPNYEHPEFFTTALLECVLYEELEIAEYLLSHGADPKLKSGYNNESPISLAEKKNNPEFLNLFRSYVPENYHSNFYKFITRIKNLFKCY